MYDEDRNTITLSLRIFSIERHDYGTYTCVASNELGEDSESMILYGECVPTVWARTRNSLLSMVSVCPQYGQGLESIAFYGECVPTVWARTWNTLLSMVSVCAQYGQGLGIYDFLW